MQNYKIAVAGLGAIGSWLYAYLSENERIELCALADGERALRLRREGIVVNGRPLELKIEGFASGEPLDFIILACKMNALEEMLEALAPRIGPRTQLLPVQNGIRSERLCIEHYGEERVLYGIARIDSNRRGNEIRFSRSRGDLMIGEASPSGLWPERLSVLAALLRDSGLRLQLPDDIRRASWQKYLWNCCYNQWLAVLDLPYRAMKESREMRTLARLIGREVLALAEAEGVDLREDDLDWILGQAYDMADEGIPSTLQDLRAGRPTEADDLAGECLRLAEKHGLDLPYSRAVWLMLKISEQKNGSSGQ